MTIMIQVSCYIWLFPVLRNIHIANICILYIGSPSKYNKDIAGTFLLYSVTHTTIWLKTIPCKILLL